ncbi:MAG: hypothetical protein MZV64_31250 [Ignavibacteriales bacterium]|nr:hypothetical protein [Ignavibacteriales bacterium]
MIVSPVRIRLVASGTPVTQGIPYSLAMMEPWMSMPPLRSTIAAASGTTKVMVGSTASQTMTSPALNRNASAVSHNNAHGSGGQARPSRLSDDLTGSCRKAIGFGVGGKRGMSRRSLPR